ncbi:MAG: KpsF/GutQ family sugar-phosphate isomerase [Bacteroidetes bacterium]|nr:KpsF/GutQ family sugar-phosphate isomerase [Bacteroidota bacterium]MDA0902984.1 KpsF/GutQ family sugar-phosphate isomerase [Bacteroidota bacterium]MDA1241600.1 KpsF/GutQ family sugar-phosphate isomerase [Bacteroidota bacterium]
MNKAPISKVPDSGFADDGTQLLEAGRRSLQLVSEATERAANQLNTPFLEALKLISRAVGVTSINVHRGIDLDRGNSVSQGKVVVTGVGKSAHIAAKISATLNSTGTPSLFLHAGEALHGDVGAVMPADAVICLSKSGASEEIVSLIPALKRRGCSLIALTANAHGPLAKAADVVIDLGVTEEACPHDLAPTTSTSLQLAMGDALAMALMSLSGFRAEDFAKNHPAGALGKRLTWTLNELLDPTRTPSVNWNAPIEEVLRSMSNGRYGATVVMHRERAHDIGGIITDGDLRRAMMAGTLQGACAGDVASTHAHTLDASMLAHHAAKHMQETGISQVIVTRNGKYAGMVHVHDCMREGLV